ncbi:Vesicle-associated protein 1-2, partial [Dichanthelium oligosanthes]
LRFPFELNKEISCVLQLMNKSDDFIAFSAKTNKSKYYTRPDNGIMSPWSMRYIVATMRAQEGAPSDMQCNDMFILQNTSVREGLADIDINEQLFAERAPKVVDEMKLPIVYVPLAQHH